ncbi:DUF6575 domain-containing protein [Deinococcus wulumuqiensis]|uniref:DUF6575 domain-containing protein n=1 Tax=Deinococcus wulumuqiensis TaxID=980427 RepID=A0AAV4K478_9DEIO|nr:DUF6575 domain-containing protein [Deinococcus wulumuqiensis]QII20823.1 hypothetical protein G6R31_08670 [Deinococcus wulumuqiensis R12]GGI80416.1 hypothetical protein GCM10010914_13350 [Deinococcus wulumuqiensis]GGP29348.1 hypothetical protein GCM10008021_09990 [Deinococcus wulumuqiensis]
MQTKDTPLGNLTLVTVFEFNDFPILFSCKNDTDQIFIANWIASSTTIDEWLFCPVSPLRHSQVVRGEMDYYSIFKNSETKHSMVIRYNKLGSVEAFEWVESASIPDDKLPLPGDFAEIEPLEVADQLRPASEDIVARAIELRSTVGHLHFDERDVRGHKASTHLVGKGLVEFQAVLDAVGQAVEGQPTYRGSISREILGQTHTYVVAFNSGSLDVEIAADDTATLYDNSLTVNAFYKAAQIIADSGDYQKLQAIMPQMGPRVAARYKRFLSTLKDYRADVVFEFSGAAGVVGGRSGVTYEQAVVAFENITRLQEDIAEKITVIGTLIGLDKSNNHFTIRDTEMKVYSGKFNEDDGDYASGAVIDASYSAQLVRMVEIDTVSGKETSRWILKGLTLISLPE